MNTGVYTFVRRQSEKENIDYLHLFVFSRIGDNLRDLDNPAHKLLHTCPSPTEWMDDWT